MPARDAGFPLDRAAPDRMPAGGVSHRSVPLGFKAGGRHIRCSCYDREAVAGGRCVARRARGWGKEVRWLTPPAGDVSPSGLRGRRQQGMFRPLAGEVAHRCECQRGLPASRYRQGVPPSPTKALPRCRGGRWGGWIQVWRHQVWRSRHSGLLCIHLQTLEFSGCLLSVRAQRQASRIYSKILERSKYDEGRPPIPRHALCRQRR